MATSGAIQAVSFASSRPLWPIGMPHSSACFNMAANLRYERNDAILLFWHRRACPSGRGPASGVTSQRVCPRSGVKFCVKYKHGTFPCAQRALDLQYHPQGHPDRGVMLCATEIHRKIPKGAPEPAGPRPRTTTRHWYVTKTEPTSKATGAFLMPEPRGARTRPPRLRVVLVPGPCPCLAVPLLLATRPRRAATRSYSCVRYLVCAPTRPLLVKRRSRVLRRRTRQAALDKPRVHDGQLGFCYTRAIMLVTAEKGSLCVLIASCAGIF